MKKTIIITFSFCLLVSYSTTLQSCAKYTVTTSQKNTADVVYKKWVAKSYFWGAINKPHSMIDTTCGKGGLSEVKITSNLGYSIIHVATLGIVHLVKVECKCQKEPPIIGNQP